MSASSLASSSRGGPSSQTALRDPLTAALEADVAAARPSGIVIGSAHQADATAMWLLLIVLVAVALRLLVLTLGPASDIQRAIYPDSARYLELANNLIQRGGFGLEAETSGLVHVPLAQLRRELGQLEPITPQGLRPEVFRTPGYPAMIALIQWLGLPLQALLVVQCLISAASALLVYGIARVILKSQGAALLAAAIAAVHPADVIAPASILSETLAIGLMLLGLWLAVDLSSRHVHASWIGGLMLGLATLVRPIAIAVGPIVALWMVLTDRRLKTLGMALVLLAASLAPPAIWMARNHHVGFGYRLSSVPHINGLFYTVAYMRITEAGGDHVQDWPATVDTLMQELRSQATADEDVFDTMQRMTRSQITAQPLLYAQVMGRSVVKFFTDHSVNGFFQQMGLPYHPTGLRDRLLNGEVSLTGMFDLAPDALALVLALGWAGLNVLLSLGALIGAVLLVVRRNWRPLLFLAGLMAYFVFATQANGLERFRLPVLGVEAMLLAAIFVPGPPRPKKIHKPKKRWWSVPEDPVVEDDEPVRPVGEGRPI